MTARLPAFNVLVDLARHDKEGLENLRQKLVESVIESAPSDSSRRKLRGVQFKIDMARRKAPNNLSATIAISEMMCQSLAELHRNLVMTTDDVPQPALIDATTNATTNAMEDHTGHPENNLAAQIIEFPTG